MNRGAGGSSKPDRWLRPTGYNVFYHATRVRRVRQASLVDAERHHDVNVSAHVKPLHEPHVFNQISTHFL